MTTKPAASEDDGIVRVRYDVRITPRLVAAIVGPYAWDRLFEQIKAIAPISLFLFVFQLLVLRQGIIQAITVILTVIAAFDPKARDLIGVAWDAGGITTGTVTAPLVLALGVGMAKVLGKGNSSMSGFGIIT